MDSQRQLLALGARIKEIRLNAKLSQERLAENAKLDRTYISMVERAKRNPSYLNLVKIAQGLGVKVGTLTE